MQMMMTDTLSSSTDRIFDVEKWVRFSLEEAIVTEISITKYLGIAVWGVHPGQEVPAHTHPDGQDTWIIIRGELTYYLGNGEKKVISSGQIDIAEPLQVHGAINEGSEDVVFLSIYSAPSLKVIPASP